MALFTIQARGLVREAPPLIDVNVEKFFLPRRHFFSFHFSTRQTADGSQYKSMPKIASLRRKIITKKIKN